jgi:hypothetical protein
MFNTLTVASFDAFLAKLNAFDYYYSYTDDGKVWQRGNEQYLEIKKIIVKPQFDAVYAAWEAWYTEKKPEMREPLKMALDLIRANLSKDEDRVKITLTRPGKARDYLSSVHTSNAYLNSRAREAAALYAMLNWQQTEQVGTVVAKIYGARIIKVFTELDVCAGRIIIDDVPFAYQHENCLVAYLLAKYW